VTFNPNNTATAPTINFTTPGSYSITVAATNSLGTNSNTKVITITNCNSPVNCSDTITNVLNTGTLSVSAAGSDTATPGCSPKAGYVMGSNCYDDKEKAEFFPTSLYSSITSPQIKSVIVLFYKNGTRGTGGNSATAVNMKLYNGTMASGPTGTAAPFGQVNATIGNITAVTATNSVNYVGQQPIVYTSAILSSSIVTPGNINTTPKINATAPGYNITNIPVVPTKSFDVNVVNNTAEPELTAGMPISKTLSGTKEALDDILNNLETAEGVSTLNKQLMVLFRELQLPEGFKVEYVNYKCKKMS
jgi:hypothetical protein